MVGFRIVMEKDEMFFFLGLWLKGGYGRNLRGVYV